MPFLSASFLFTLLFWLHYNQNDFFTYLIDHWYFPSLPFSSSLPLYFSTFRHMLYAMFYQNILSQCLPLGEFWFIFQFWPSKLELLASLSAFCGHWFTPLHYLSYCIVITYFLLCTYHHWISSERAKIMSVFLTCSSF